MLIFLHSVGVKLGPVRAGYGWLGCSSWLIRAPLPSPGSYRHDRGVSEGILCHPHVGGVVGWDVMTRGEEPLFSIAVCMKDAVVWEWGNSCCII